MSLAILAAVVFVRYWDPSLIYNLRLEVYDNYQRLKPRNYEPAPVKVIDIDDASLQQYGQWPWPRTLIAELVQKLNGLGVATIGFDIVFAETDRLSPQQFAVGMPEDALQLKEMLKALPENDAVLADTLTTASIVLGISGANINTGNIPELKSGFAHAGTAPHQLVPQFEGAISNLPELEKSAIGQGSFSINTVDGGIVRSVPLLQNIGGTLFPTLAIETLRVAQGASTIVTRSSDASGEFQIGDRISLQSLRVGDFEVPLAANGEMLMHYTETVADRLVSAKDVLEFNDFAGLINKLQGHIVLIGTSATGLKDIRATPLSSFEPGVLIHAQAMEQIILQKFLYRPNWADGAEIIGLLLIGLLLIFSLSKLGAIWSAVIGLTTSAATIFASWKAFADYQLLFDPVYAFIAAFLVYVTATIFGYAQAEKSRNYIRKAFSTYLSPALVAQLAEDPSRLRLDGEAKNMTFLFTDIEGFTTLTEKTEPKLLVNTLNEYLDQACQIIINHGGTIDKMIGDAIVALYNAPVEQLDHAEKAVQTALELDKFCTAFSAQAKAKGVDMGLTRIGINTGTAIAGNFGGENRFDYTVIGDAVNTAARLESVNKFLGTRVCIAGETAKGCKEQFFRPVGALVLKGKTVGIDAFEPITKAIHDSPPMQRYLALFQRINQGEEISGAEFQEVLRELPGDPIVSLYQKRFENGLLGTEIVLDEK